MLIEIPQSDIINAAKELGHLNIIEAPTIKNAWWKVLIAHQQLDELQFAQSRNIRFRLPK